jgi:hypothetical protein
LKSVAPGSGAVPLYEQFIAWEMAQNHWADTTRAVTTATVRRKTIQDDRWRRRRTPRLTPGLRRRRGATPYWAVADLVDEGEVAVRNLNATGNAYWFDALSKDWTWITVTPLWLPARHKTNQGGSRCLVPVHDVGVR